MTGNGPQPLLRDLLHIQDEVRDGDYVLNLSKGVTDRETIANYVVTDQLAEAFDEALGVIRSAVEGRVSRAVYLDGSFGSGKSHFMAVLHAVLRGVPEARAKKGLAAVVDRHEWLAERTILLVPYHLIGSTSLESAILGGYVRYVQDNHPDAPLPLVFLDDRLLDDARRIRAAMGDAAFIAGLPAEENDEWGEPTWTTQSLDEAFAAAPRTDPRNTLVQHLLATYLSSYAGAVRTDTASFVSLDEGLSVISAHAKEQLGADALVLLLDELVLWLSNYLADTTFVQTEAAKVPKLVESEHHHRPAPIVSFVPRQRDLRELVGRDVAGANVASLFDSLKYAEGRFEAPIRLADANLPAIVAERLLVPVNDAARARIDAAFNLVGKARADVWETLIDAQGGRIDREDFRRTYPFSPAFLHTMVDVSSALQRQRTALKLMARLLISYGDVLPVGQLMPIGAIYDVLAERGDEPFDLLLREEFKQAKRFYADKLRPHLLAKHGLKEADAAGVGPKHPFRSDDLVVKTLLLAALVPRVPPLRDLTAGRLAALNHGSIAAMLPGQERVAVTRTLKALAGEFGEIQLSDADDPAVHIQLFGIDTAAILNQRRYVENESAKRTLVKKLLWEEFGARDDGSFVTVLPFIWRGTDRVAELLFANVRDPDNIHRDRFEPEMPGAVRVIIDYPFDEPTQGPQDDLNRVEALQQELDRPATIVWLPNFLSAGRRADLGDLVVINHVLERENLADAAPALTDEERDRARVLLQGRRGALELRLREVLAQAYGLNKPVEADISEPSPRQLVGLDRSLEVLPPVGRSLRDALPWFCGKVLAHRHPDHPDFDVRGRNKAVSRAELTTVLTAVKRAAEEPSLRYEPPRADLPVLRRIAHPLQLATVDNEVFVLRTDWQLSLDRRIAHSGDTMDVRVGRLKRWITEDERLGDGLPPIVVELVVAAYAVMSDRTWVRGERAQAEPALGQISSDFVLRRQEKPEPEEFDRANRRAQEIFGLPRQHTSSARAVQALASGVYEASRGALEACERLTAHLNAHAELLALDEDAPRLVTARTTEDLVQQMAMHDNATQLVKALAAADLPDEPVFCRASLRTARALAADFNAVRWPILGRLPALAAGQGPKAEEARRILENLRSAARHDEHAQALSGPLLNAERKAIELVTSDDPKPDPDPLPPDPLPPLPPPLPEPDRVVRRVSAHDLRGVDAALAELRRRIQADPGAQVEITWRVLPGEDR